MGEALVGAFFGREDAGKGGITAATTCFQATLSHLEDIRRMLSLSQNPAVSCERVDALIEVQLQRVRTQRAALDRLEKQLGQLRARCRKGHHVADWGTLRELMHAAHGEACACHGAISA